MWPSSVLSTPVPIPIPKTLMFIWWSFRVSWSVSWGWFDFPSVITIRMLATPARSPEAALKLFASTYLSARSVRVPPEWYPMAFIALTVSALLWWVFKLNSLCGVEAKVTTPICTFRGPISKLWAKRATKLFCFWKFEEPTDPDESSKNTMSAGFEPQPERTLNVIILTHLSILKFCDTHS